MRVFSVYSDEIISLRLDSYPNSDFFRFLTVPLVDLISEECLMTSIYVGNLAFAATEDDV